MNEIVSNNNRILIVDDNTSIHSDFKEVLCPSGSQVGSLSQMTTELFDDDEQSSSSKMPSYEIESAFEGLQALEMVHKAEEERRPFALAFVDIRMPAGWDGIKTIASLWEAAPHMEMVICTAYSDYSWRNIIAKLGSTDRLLFLRKPFDTTAVKQIALSQTRKWNLAREAEQYVERLKHKIAEHKRLEDRLNYLAYHDLLTELPNRNQLYQDLEEALKKAQNDSGMLALLFVDLKNFKTFNYTLGYKNGDKLLEAVSARFCTVIDNMDSIVACLGSDEFAFLLPNIHSKDDAAAFAEKINQAMQSPFQISGQELELGASISIALFPDHAKNADTLMQYADMAMLAAKEAESGYCFYSDDLF